MSTNERERFEAEVRKIIREPNFATYSRLAGDDLHDTRPYVSEEMNHMLALWQARAAEAVATVPDGWAMAPREPTDAMSVAAIRVGLRKTGQINGVDYWKAMLAAAPPAPVVKQDLTTEPGDDDPPHQARTLALLSGHCPIGGGYISHEGTYVLDWDDDSKHQLSIGVKADGRIWFARYDDGVKSSGQFDCDGNSTPPEILAQLRDRFGTADTPATVKQSLSAADEHGCECQGCGLHYRYDLLVPDHVWERIKPSGKDVGAGLLCAHCIMRRITDSGIWTAARAHDVDATPERVSNSYTLPEVGAYQLRCNGGQWQACRRETFERGNCGVESHSCEVRALYATPPADAPTFQHRVQPWMQECFGAEISADRQERNHRFAEEAMELVQANGMPRADAHALVDYVYNRPAGELTQEVGGVMVTLAALCLASDADMHANGETELARISNPETIAKIRAKQAAKPRGSALPVYVATAEALDAARMQGRSEAAALLLATYAETFYDDYIGESSGYGPDSEPSMFWRVEKVHELLHASTAVYDMQQKAEGEFYHYQGLRLDAENAAERRRQEGATADARDAEDATIRELIESVRAGKNFRTQHTHELVYSFDEAKRLRAAIDRAMGAKDGQS